MLKTTLAITMVSWFAAHGALSFVRPPTIVGNGADWTIDFEVSESTDVEVTVVNTSDSTLIRHLAAGVLGANPPAPFVASSLRQTIAWDGKDDAGAVAAAADGEVGVRVRAGMGVTQDKIAGGNPYVFNLAFGFNGLKVSREGRLYAYGRAAYNEFTTLRLYDGAGVYERTLFPYPAGLAEAGKSGFGVYNMDGRSFPKMTRLYGPMVTTTIAASELSIIADIEDPAACWLFQPGENKMMYIENDGGTRANSPVVPIVTSPAYPNHYTFGGPGYLTRSPDNRVLYFSGFFQSVKGDNTDPITADTGFWRDGHVFRIDAATGIATHFLSQDSIPVLSAVRALTIGGEGRLFAAFGSVECDDSGRVFVCDRFHGRIGVYDTNGVLLASIALKFPDMVKIDHNTGAIYALQRNKTGYHEGYTKLFKYSSWQGNPAPVCSVRVSGTGMGSFEGSRAFLGIDNSNGSVVVWVGDAAYGIKSYRDDGSALTLVQNWSAVYAREYAKPAENGLVGFDKVVVDRRNETIYINNGVSGLAKIEDWDNPEVKACTTEAGRRLYATDLAMGPGNALYVIQGPGYTGPVTRWASGSRYLDSLPFANSGKNMVTHEIYGRMHPVGGYGPKGMAVSPEGKVAVQYMYQFARYFVGVFGDSGATDNLERCDSIMKPTCPDAGLGGALRYDSKGNLYMGVALHVPGFPAMAGWDVADESYSKFTGSIARIPSSTVRGRFSANRLDSLSGYDKLYPIPLGAYSANCWCRMPIFDVDPWDRLCVPSAATLSVTVADNAGNTILKFGEYGNYDDRSGLPFAFPTGVAASDDYLYVTDLVNTRVVRVKKTFVLDNMPGVAPSGARSASTGADLPEMAVIPNPMNPSCCITLPGIRGRCPVQVFNASGALVRTLEAVNGSAQWNASGMPSGVYLLKASAAGRTLLKKAVLVR